MLRGAKQIPVYRESADASKAFSAAVAGGPRAGECVAIYPEATLTRDPDLWPMVGKTGAARVALETGAPVIPVAQWGPQELLPPYAKRPHLFPRKTMHVWAGPPVDLDGRSRAGPMDAALLHEVTERIMAAITALLEEIRGEQAPAVAVRPASSRACRVTGDPRRPAVTTEGHHRVSTPRQSLAALPTRGPRMTRVAVLGTGSWGTAFAMVLADAGTDVVLWGRRQELVRRDHPHPREPRLPAGHPAARDRAPRPPTPPRRSTAPRSWSSPCRRRRCAATSSTGSPTCRPDAVLVSLMKGIELGTTQRMSEVIAEVTGRRPERIAVVSGPTWPGRSPCGSPRASVVGLRRRGGRREAAAGLPRRRTSGPTRTPTWSASSSAAR